MYILPLLTMAFDILSGCLFFKKKLLQLLDQADVMMIRLCSRTRSQCYNIESNVGNLKIRSTFV